MLFLKGLESKLKWDIFWVGLIQAANYFFPFITTTYLIRTIGVDFFGRTEFATLLMLYFITLTNYEFHISGTRRISIIKDNPSKLGQVFNVIFTAKIYLFLLSVLFFAAITVIWPSRFANVLFYYSFLIVLGHLFYQPHMFLGTGKAKLLAILNLIIKLISTLLIFIFIRSEEDFEKVNLNYSLSFICIGLISFYYASRLYGINFSWKSFRSVKKILKDGFYIFLTNGLIAQVNFNLAAIILGIYMEPAVLGSYSAALKLIIAVHILSLLPLKQVFFPVLSSLWISDKNEFYNKFRSYLSIVLLGNLLLGGVVLLLASWIIRIVYGDYYEQMILVMRMLAFLPLLIGLINVFNDGLVAIGKDRQVFHIQLVFAIVNVISLLIIVPEWGLEGMLVLRLLVDFLALLFSAIVFYKIFQQGK